MPDTTTDAITQTLTLPDDVEQISDLGQYYGDWAIEETAARGIHAHLMTMDLSAHIRAQQRRLDQGAEAASYEVVDGVAIVEIQGMITKRGSSLSGFPGTVRMRRTMRMLRDDKVVGAVMLLVESPGGTVLGTEDLGDEIAALNSVKPVTAYIEDMGASGAYWLASQAGRVVANGPALVGSIGTYVAISDLSARTKEMGIKVHVIKAGEHKGDFIPGTEVTDKQLDEAQRRIDSRNGRFIAAVSRGRGMSESEVRGVADGRAHLATEAQRLGLIDAVETQDEAFEALREKATDYFESEPNTRSKDDMPENNSKKTTPDDSKAPETGPETKSETPEGGPTKSETPAEPPAPKPATHAEIREALPKSTADFREKCVDKGMTLTQAMSAYIEEADAKTDAGVDPVGAKGGRASKGGGSATEEWNRAIAEEAKSNGGNRSEATLTVAKRDPELRQRMIDEANAA